jgi:hypothetical protein
MTDKEQIALWNAINDPRKACEEIAGAAPFLGGDPYYNDFVNALLAMADRCAGPLREMHAADIGCYTVECQRGKNDPPLDCIYPDCPCGVYYAPEFRDMYYLQWALGPGFGEIQFSPRKLFTEDHCPGHVASASDAKVCGRCGVHIDELRPEED